MSFYIRIGNHVHVRSRNNVHSRAIFATMFFVMVFTLGSITGLFNVSEIVRANSVNGSGTGIYWDQSCTNRTLSFDWGPIEPGSNKIFAVYIRNEGDSAACLFMKTSNWTPSEASSYMTLNWNYSGQILSVDQVIPLELILAVSPSITGITHFSFDTTIDTTS